MSFSKFKIIVTAGFEKPKIISEDCKCVCRQYNIFIRSEYLFIELHVKIDPISFNPIISI